MSQSPELIYWILADVALLALVLIALSAYIPGIYLALVPAVGLPLGLIWGFRGVFEAFTTCAIIGVVPAWVEAKLITLLSLPQLMLIFGIYGAASALVGAATMRALRA